MTLDAKIPDGPLDEKWDRHRFQLKLINPANKRKYHLIVVGSGLAGAAPTASPPRAASTPPRTIRTTGTASFASSTTP